MRTDCIIYFDYVVFGTTILALMGVATQGFPNQISLKIVGIKICCHFILPVKAFKIPTTIYKDYTLMREKKSTTKKVERTEFQNKD